MTRWLVSVLVWAYPISPKTATDSDRHLATLISHHQTAETAVKNHTIFQYADTAQKGQEIDRDYILRPGENINDKIRNNIFIRVFVSKGTCYINEPILVSYVLYSRLPSKSSVTRIPAFAGFSAFDITQVQVDSGNIKPFHGKVFTTHLLLQKQLVALQVGNLQLDAMELTNTIEFGRVSGNTGEQDNSLNTLLNELSKEESRKSVKRSFVLTSKPIIVKVSSPPLGRQPADFNGLVGHFKVSSTLSRSTISVQDTALYSVRIQGTGYLPILTAPVISWPIGLEAYDIKTVADFNKSEFPMAGSKIFQYIILSKKPGFYEIPPLSLSFYNDVLQSYQTLITIPRQLTITGGQSGRSLRPALYNPQWNLNQTIGWGSENARLLWWFNYAQRHWKLWAGFATMFGAVSLLFVFAQRRQKNATKIPEKIVAELHASVAPPEEPLDPATAWLLSKNFHGFYVELNQVLRAQIAIKGEISVSEVNPWIIDQIGKQNGWPPEMTTGLIELMAACDKSLYSPGYGDQQAAVSLQKAKQFLTLLT